MIREDWSRLSAPIGRFDRVVVIDQTPSTQDDARLLCEGKPGLALIGKRQLGGRGRQGRTWDDCGGASLSMSMVVRNGLPAAGLSLAIGLAIVEACESLGLPGLGLKWPNDVVERSASGPGRKLAGVLIEASHTWAVVGVGVNVSQGPADWSAELRGSAVSLAELGLHVDRPTLAATLLEHISGWLEAPPTRIRERWLDVGTLRGTRCVLRVEGQHVIGTVRDLDSQWRLVIDTDSGAGVRVDAAHAHFEETDAVER